MITCLKGARVCQCCTCQFWPTDPAQHICEECQDDMEQGDLSRETTKPKESNERKD